MPYTFVVARDRPDLFAYLRDVFADDPDMVVLWDRRAGHGRRRRDTVVPVERRRRDRRAVPLGTWKLLGFIVVPPSLTEANSSPGRGPAVVRA
jgi:hypothetical protein